MTGRDFDLRFVLAALAGCCTREKQNVKIRPMETQSPPIQKHLGDVVAQLVER